MFNLLCGDIGAHLYDKGSGPKMNTSDSTSTSARISTMRLVQDDYRVVYPDVMTVSCRDGGVRPLYLCFVDMSSHVDILHPTCPKRGDVITHRIR